MEVVVRATITFWLLWLLVRGTGKRQLAELAPFELILLFVMGDIIQQGVTQEDMSLTGSALAVSTMALWTVVASWASFRSTRVRRVLDGDPVVIVRDGEPLLDRLRRDRMTIADVHEAARNQGITDLADVEIGLLEPDGRFSFLRYPDAGRTGDSAGRDSPGDDPDEQREPEPRRA